MWTSRHRRREGRRGAPAVHPLLLLLVCGCANPPAEEGPPADAPGADAAPRTVFVYRACDGASPGALVAVPRTVPADLDPVAGAIGQLVEGVTEAGRQRGCTSLFSARPANALRAVRSGAGGDTVTVVFRDFTDALPDAPRVTSFLPPGVMAELTWTLFDQFPDIAAVRFSFEGDERAFWEWVGGEGTEPRVVTRAMWERI